MSEVGQIRKVLSDRIIPQAGGRMPAEKTVPASPIGLFDSGVGGLSVLQQLFRQLPHEDVVYLADTARVPYGGRPPEEIVAINREIIPYLIKQGVKLVIMACGTSSAIAYPALKDDYPVELISLIEHGARAALAASRHKKIGLIATAATVNSRAYQHKIKELDGAAEVHAVGCPLFVPLVEGGYTEAPETRRVAREYLQPLLQEGIDTLVLGCTHYPHLALLLRQITGPGVTLVDPAEAAVAEAKRLLKQAGTLRTTAVPGKYSYLVTGTPGQFEEVGSRLLGKPIAAVKQVVL